MNAFKAAYLEVLSDNSIAIPSNRLLTENDDI